MERITNNQLELMVERLNTAKGFEAKPEYSTVGSYDLDSAYGGVKLVKYVNEQGGQTDITSGYGTKRELYNQLRAILEVI